MPWITISALNLCWFGRPASNLRAKFKPKICKISANKFAFYGVKNRADKFALKFNKKTIKIYAKSAKQTAKCQIWQKRQGKPASNEPRRKNERNPHKYRPCRDADFIYVCAGILSHHLPSVVFLQV